MFMRGNKLNTCKRTGLTFPELEDETIEDGNNHHEREVDGVGKDAKWGPNGPHIFLTPWSRRCVEVIQLIPEKTSWSYLTKYPGYT